MPTVLVIDDAYLGQVLEVLGVRGGRVAPIRAVTAGAAAATWEEVLTAGNQSGLTSPTVSAGSPLIFAKVDPDGFIQSLGGTLLVQGQNTNAIGVDGSHVEVRAGSAARANGGFLRLIAGGGGGAGFVGGTLIIEPGPSPGGTNGIVELHNANGVIVQQIADGGVAWGAGVPALSPAVVGARGGNAALASLLTTLAGMGLITDNTTP